MCWSQIKDYESCCQKRQEKKKTERRKLPTFRTFIYIGACSIFILVTVNAGTFQWITTVRVGITGLTLRGTRARLIQTSWTWNENALKPSYLIGKPKTYVFYVFLNPYLSCPKAGQPGSAVIFVLGMQEAAGWSPSMVRGDSEDHVQVGKECRWCCGVVVHSIWL